MPDRGWLRLAIGGGMAMLLAMGLGRFSYTAMVPLLIEGGWLSEAEAGYVGGVNLAGFLLGALATEWLRRRIALTVILRMAILAAAIGLLASALEIGFWWLAFWRGLLGVTVGIVMVLGLAVTTAVTPETDRPLGTAVIFSGVGCGIFLSGTLVPWLAQNGILAAWFGVAILGLFAAAGAMWGWRDLGAVPFSEHHPDDAPSVTQPAWCRLLLAHAYFSIGLIPHTIYWVDFIARELGQGLSVAGAYWSGAGVCAVVGPIAGFFLARKIGTPWALVIAFAALAAGIAAPGFDGAVPILVLSSIIFGAQPGLSALIAARARDIGHASAMPRLMRQMILINGAGAAIAGLAFPALFEAVDSYRSLFWIAGGVMGLGALLAVPWPNLASRH
ncbi:MAG TPA: hypothetical protein DCE33_14955 [Rhodospirillaceae bacterium]|nr:hypothetical protein [Rhodospirillaceae bacterium]